MFSNTGASLRVHVNRTRNIRKRLLFDQIQADVLGEFLMTKNTITTDVSVNNSSQVSDRVFAVIFQICYGTESEPGVWRRVDPPTLVGICNGPKRRKGTAVSSTQALRPYCSTPSTTTDYAVRPLSGQELCQMAHGVASDLWKRSCR